MAAFTPRQDQKNYMNGLFSHSKAESLLQRICNTVEKHEIEITSLRCDIDSSHNEIKNEISSIQNAISTMNSQISTLLHRVQSIEDSIRIPGSSSNTSVSEVVVANRRTLARTLNLVSQKADMDSVKKVMDSESQILKESIEALKRDLASNDAVQKSNEAMSALVSRVDTMASDMCNKVDRSLFKSIASDATCIKNYAVFVRDTEATTKKLEIDIEKIGTTMLEHDKGMISYQGQIQKLELDLQKHPSNDKFEEIVSNMQLIGNQLQNKADESITLQLQQDNVQSRAQLISFEDDVRTLFAAHETLAKYLTKRLDNTYNKSSVDKILCSYLQSDEFEDNIQELNTIIETKACKESLSQLQDFTQQLESDLGITKRKADLVSQFVGWYGKGGDENLLSENLLKIKDLIGKS